MDTEKKVREYISKVYESSKEECETSAIEEYGYLLFENHEDQIEDVGTILIEEHGFEDSKEFREDVKHCITVEDFRFTVTLDEFSDKIIEMLHQSQPINEWLEEDGEVGKMAEFYIMAVRQEYFLDAIKHGHYDVELTYSDNAVSQLQDAGHHIRY